MNILGSLFIREFIPVPISSSSFFFLSSLLISVFLLFASSWAIQRRQQQGLRAIQRTTERRQGKAEEEKVLDKIE
jgi:hypothetical protein